MRVCVHVCQTESVYAMLCVYAVIEVLVSTVSRYPRSQSTARSCKASGPVKDRWVFGKRERREKGKGERKSKEERERQREREREREREERERRLV